MVTHPVLLAEETTGQRLRQLRQRCKFSIRHLAELAQLSTGYISGVENGAICPTIAALRKLLVAMGSDLGDFFTEERPTPTGPVFRREEMACAGEAHRSYTLILPRRDDIKVEMLEEELRSGVLPEFEELASDLTGYVLQGELLLEIQGSDSQLLRTGDAFYIPAGQPARGRCIQDTPVRLITVIVPPRY
jgi:transcriptional regulator with XRE-family HTH domain